MTLTGSLLMMAALATATPNGSGPTHEFSPALERPILAITAVEVAPQLPLRDPRSTKPSVERWMRDQPERRPAALPVMYATLGALQAFDVYSTRQALGAGAREANPLMENAAGSSGTMLAAKALSTAGTIYFTERAWKKNRKGAIAMMVIINGATAAIAAHNLRNASR